LARAEEAITEELNTEELSRRRGSQPVRFGGNEAHALAVSEVATACAELVKLFVYVGWNSYRFRWGSIRSG
ncbi:hypothetical protein, partial [Arthrobacter sp. M4]|uniref:hypothetical protein n=1 Tax=Arthrobacter sp. M4 TaxID=218160 RepID=UPI001CDC97F1